MTIAILLFLMSGFICSAAWLALWFVVKFLDESDE